MLGEHLQQRPKCRCSAFLLDKKRRLDLAGRVIHCHDQVELGLSIKPGKPTAILMQHHANAWLARPLATMCGPPDSQVGLYATGLHPGVAQAEIMLLLQMLVEMLDGPAAVMRAVFRKHPGHLVDWHPPRGRFAQPSAEQTLEPFFLVASPVTSELPLRATQDLASFLCGKFFRFPPAQHVAKTSPSCGPVAMSSGSSIRLPTEAGNRTTRVLPNSCATDKKVLSSIDSGGVVWYPLTTRCRGPF
jgi:hypothetical protein